MPTAIEVYVNEPIQYASERAVYDSIVRLLGADGKPAIILVNANLGGRQLDLVIGLEHATLVLEAKGYSGALRGKANGRWYVQTAGGWVSTPNAYQQVLGAKNALRDSARAVSGSELGYPHGLVVFAPRVPLGSELEAGDFKAAMVSLEKLDAELKQSHSPPWPIDTLRAVAAHYGLRRVNDLSAAIDSTLYDAEALLETYTAAFRKSYQPAQHIVPFQCREQSNFIGSEDVANRVAMGASVLLDGPPGCGKSLLARRIAEMAIDAGAVPLFLEAKNFGGTLRELMDNEAVLLDMPSATALMRAIRLRSSRLLLIVDGYNECRAGERPRLTRAIAAAVRRFGADVLITTNTPVEKPNLFELARIDVPAPARNVRAEIARAAANNDTMPAGVEALLESVSSGLEAKMVGEVGARIRPGTGRFGLFDHYVRHRLGSAESDGIAFLAMIAAELASRISFSLTTREVERLAGNMHRNLAVLPILYSVGLLANHSGRISFSHELFLNALAAEAQVRDARDEEQILASLNAPINANRKAMIIGAIDNLDLLFKVLSRLETADAIISCLNGECGRPAQEWAEKKCNEVLRKGLEEFRFINFEIDKGAWMNVRMSPASLFPWSSSELAIVAALPHVAMREPHFAALFDGARLLDERASAAFTDLREEAKRENIALRSGLFANCYLGNQPRQAALVSVFARLHSGFLGLDRVPDVWGKIATRLEDEHLTPGQLYLLLTLYRGNGRGNVTEMAGALSKLLPRFWPKSAYHLRLDLLDVARFSWGAQEPERTALLEALEALQLPEFSLLTTSWAEAIQALGGLDESERAHGDELRTQLRGALAEPEKSESWHLCFHIYSGQFDHPFSSAYCEILNELPDDDRKRFLVMAARGAGMGESDLFVAPLIVDLGRFDDPAMAEYVRPWMQVPRQNVVMHTDAINAFLTAHVVLGQLGAEWIPLSYENEGAAALGAYGEIIYWLNRVDLSERERTEGSQEALRLLLADEATYAASALMELESNDQILIREGIGHLPRGHSAVTSVRATYPAETAEICRRCLLRADAQRSYFNFFDPSRLVDFAIQVLGLYGGVSDLPILRSLSRLQSQGRAAIRSIKEIEERVLV